MVCLNKKTLKTFMVILSWSLTVPDRSFIVWRIHCERYFVSHKQNSHRVGTMPIGVSDDSFNCVVNY